MIYIIVPLIGLGVYFILMSFQNRNEKKIDEKAKRARRDEEIMKQISQIRNTNMSISIPNTKWYPLDPEQQELIKLWKRHNMFKEHTDNFENIINMDKYTESDRKILSNCRNTYISIKDYMERMNSMKPTTPSPIVNEYGSGRYDSVPSNVKDHYGL